MNCRAATSTHLSELIVLLVVLTAGCGGGSGGGEQTTPRPGDTVNPVEPEPERHVGFTDATADSGLSYEVGLVFDSESASPKPMVP